VNFETKILNIYLRRYRDGGIKDHFMKSLKIVVAKVRASIHALFYVYVIHIIVLW